MRKNPTPKLAPEKPAVGPLRRFVGNVAFVVAMAFVTGLVIAAENGDLPNPLASPSPPVAHSGPGKLTDREKSQLLSEYKRALNNEMAALRHQQGIELKELKASQESRRREWKDKENAHRHELFRTTLKKPSDRQAYFKDRNDRWKAFDHILADEYQHRKNELDVRIHSMTEDHAQKLKEFEASIRKGERPSVTLWPGGSK